MLLNVAVGLWGVRLAGYLFQRILKTGVCSEEAVRGSKCNGDV